MSSASEPAENPFSLHVGDLVEWRGQDATVRSVALYPKVELKVFGKELFVLVPADELEKI